MAELVEASAKQSSTIGAKVIFIATKNGAAIAANQAR
jgi:hypothetical protein